MKPHVVTTPYWSLPPNIGVSGEAGEDKILVGTAVKTKAGELENKLRVVFLTEIRKVFLFIFYPSPSLDYWIR